MSTHKSNPMKDYRFNKGCAFTREERREYGMLGRLPHSLETLDTQVKRHYGQYEDCPTPLAKNIYLHDVHEKNQTLFYRLVRDHLVEMLPIIYTPTIGEAVEKYSHKMRRSKGLYVAYPDREYMEEIFDNREPDEVDLIVVTDGEGVLGIGDQGIGGMEIAIGKSMVYTLCGGINPNRILPIQLDVGTNNEKLMYDPIYLGWRHQRITGPDYDTFIDQFVKTVQKKFPGVYLHWEDFGRENARKNLERYQSEMCTFNDDIQGTGATALACVLAGLQGPLREQRIVVLGAGTAGVGIVDQIARAMIVQGLSPEEAHERFWLIDRYGLLAEGSEELQDFQRPYARKEGAGLNLLEVVKQVKPTVLIGCSAVHGAFNKQVVEAMAAHCERPIIMPLSNPTSRSEARPEELLAWTDGKALIATGSPFHPVHGVAIPQSNNAYVFPGLGLGVIACKPTRLTDGMIWAACETLSKAGEGQLLPKLEAIPELSKKIARAVAAQAHKDGVATACLDVDEIYWEPKYT